MKLVDIHIVLDRGQSLLALSRFFNHNRAPHIKSVRIDNCPLDKRGDIVDLVVYAFDNVGQYSLFFPKRVRLPLKMATNDEFVAVLSNTMDKIMPLCASITNVDNIDTAKGIVSDLVPSLVRELEDLAISKLGPLDRSMVLMDRMKNNGSLDRIIKERNEKKRTARERLEAVWKEFDAMTDEQFHQVVMDNVELCNSEAYREEMLPQWTERGIQSDVTQTLHDVVSLIMERGPRQTPEWGKEDEKGFEEHGFHTEFHSYRGFTVRFDSCAVDSGYHLYKDDSTHLIMI